MSFSKVLKNVEEECSNLHSSFLLGGDNLIGESLHFHFAGRKSTDFGIINVNIAETSLFNESVMGVKSIREVSIPGRDEPYFIETEEEPKTLELRFGFPEPWNDQLISEVIKWLSVNTYEPLFFEGNIDRVYYAMPIDSINKIHNGLKEGYLTLQMRCNSSKSYSHEIKTKFYDTSLIGSRNLLNNTDFSNDKDIDDWVHWLDYAKIGKKRKIDDRHFMYVSVTSDVEEGQSPRIRTPYRYKLKKNNTYTFSFVGFSSDWVDSDFTMTGIYVDGKIKNRFKLTKERIGAVRFNGFKKSLYRYYCSFNYLGEDEDNCSIFIGTRSLNGKGAYFLFSEPKLEKGKNHNPDGSDYATLTIGNRGHFNTYPKIWIEKIYDGDIVIYNTTNNNQEFRLKNIEIGEKIFVDCKKEIIETNLQDVYHYDNFNDNYIELIYGENILKITNNIKIQFAFKYIFN